MSNRLIVLLTVAGAITFAPAFNVSTKVQAKDWDDRWEDYQDAHEDYWEAQEDYWEDREDYYEDLYDNHRVRRIRYRSGYPVYGWNGNFVRFGVRSPVRYPVYYTGRYPSPAPVYRGYYPVGTVYYHGHCHH